jgi:acyl-CoA thioester hydrolase
LKAYATTITPRLYETDAMGHINNATIAAWFEVARVRFLESLANQESGLSKEWILAALQIDFVGETFYGSDVVASITEATVGNTSLTLQCEMAQGDRLTVRGSAVLVYMDYQNKSAMRVPDDLRDKIAAR